MKLFPQREIHRHRPSGGERAATEESQGERRARNSTTRCVWRESRTTIRLHLAVTEDLDGSTVGGAGIRRQVPSHSIDEIMR